MQSRLSLYVILILFFSFSFGYLRISNVLKQHLIVASVLKVLPILILIWFVRYQERTRTDLIIQKRLKYLKLGLIFSVFGDVFLVWHEYLIQGLIAFSLSHIMYISYFGIRSRNNIFGFFLFVLNSFVLLLFSSELHDKGLLIVAVPIYSYLITIMLWRSIDQWSNNHDIKTNEVWSAMGCIGGIFFTVSDLLIGIDLFVSRNRIPNILIMATYYAGQLGITLNILKQQQ